MATVRAPSSESQSREFWSVGLARCWLHHIHVDMHKAVQKSTRSGCDLGLALGHDRLGLHLRNISSGCKDVQRMLDEKQSPGSVSVDSSLSVQTVLDQANWSSTISLEPHLEPRPRKNGPLRVTPVAQSASTSRCHLENRPSPGRGGTAF